MCPERLFRESTCLSAPTSAERGFSLVSAIFLLVILSALGVFMVALSTMQQTASTQDLQGSRAYQAARAGIEWGAYQIMNPENTNPATPPFTAQYACAGPITLPVGAVSGFSVAVECASSNFIEGGNSATVYRLTSTASMGTAGTTSYIERAMTASINTCRATANGASC